MSLKRNADEAGLTEGRSGPSKEPMLKFEAHYHNSPQAKLNSSTAIRSSTTRKTLSPAQRRIAMNNAWKETVNIQPSYLNAELRAGAIAATSQKPMSGAQPLSDESKSLGQTLSCQHEKVDHDSGGPTNSDPIITNQQSGSTQSSKEELQAALVSEPPDQIVTIPEGQVKQDTGAPTKPSLQPPSKPITRTKLLRTDLEKFVLRESRKPYLKEVRLKGTIANFFHDSECGWMNIAGAQAQALCDNLSMATLLDEVLKSKRKKDRKVQSAIVNSYSRSELPHTEHHKHDMKSLGWLIREMLLGLAESAWRQKSPDKCWEHGWSKQQCNCDEILPPRQDAAIERTDPYAVTEASVAALARHWGLTEYLASLESEEEASINSHKELLIAPELVQDTVRSPAQVYSNECANQKPSLSLTASELSQKDECISSISIGMPV